MAEHASLQRDDYARPPFIGPRLFDRTLTLVTALNPILLLVVGYVLNAGIERNKAEISLAKAKIDATSEQIANLKTIAETSTLELQQRINKVKVISDFLVDLSGPDERKRSLAIEAIFIALPEEASRLVKVIEKFSKTGNQGKTADAVAAQDALSGSRARLVSDMFSSDRPTRIQALTTLQRGWSDDAVIVTLLLGRATQDVKDREAANWAAASDDEAQQRLSSIYNTVKFLSVVRVPTDPAARAGIRDFLTAVAPNSPDTKSLAGAIKKRFD
jgi:hypothetical protein